MKQLTNKQIKRQDFVDSEIFEFLQDINPSGQKIEWNIEMIADLRDRIQYWFVEYLNLTDEMTFYPYIKE